MWRGGVVRNSLRRMGVWRHKVMAGRGAPQEQFCTGPILSHSGAEEAVSKAEEERETSPWTR